MATDATEGPVHQYGCEHNEPRQKGTRKTEKKDWKALALTTFYFTNLSFIFTHICSSLFFINVYYWCLLRYLVRNIRLATKNSLSPYSICSIDHVVTIQHVTLK